MLRILLLRYGIPAVVAISVVAYFGVPYADRLLADWFRADVEQRARYVAASMEAPLARLVEKDDQKSLRNYLSKVIADERVLAVMLCRSDGSVIFKTDLTPSAIACISAEHPADESNYVLPIQPGSVGVSAFLAKPAKGLPFRMLIVQDLSFIDRRQSTARSYVLAFVGVFASIVALLVGFTAWLLVRRWVKVLVGDIRGLRFLDDAESPSASRPILSQVRKVLREIEHNQRLEIDFHENWTPQALQQVVKEHLGSPEMFVVSNRQPYVHTATLNGPIVQVPASGMVTALEPIMRACSGTWVAHGSGSADRQVVDLFDRIRVPPDSPAYTLKRVWLSAEEEEGYYYGFSNEGLWPLCHLTYVRPAFREADWHAYQAVNNKFAQVVVRESRSANPVVLIQDYHFALLPRLLRARKPKATIVLFWHIPWPNAETFGVCPWKRDMLMHMLAADILGFHTRYHCQNFLDTVDRFVECQIDREHMSVTLQGHVCRVVPYPISIEWPPRWLAQLPSIAISASAIRSRYKIAANVSLGVGVERWDFTKGIIERFHALETLLDKDRSVRGRVTLLQVAAPSRSKLPAYQALQQQTIDEAQRINQKFSSDDWKPIVLIKEHQEPQQVFELYRAADFCLVNSLHDGMNLVAKEFVAARDDEDGVLILSTFAGASRELVESLLINPFDVAETAAAIKTAMDMPRDERRERMKLMRRTVKENNVFRWAGRMLMDAARIRQRQALSNMTSLSVDLLKP
ncbi:MAG: trehalose-6-phosphate synthase [Candidatus Obscuribacterales bacterium]|nr:trehalose-6-phosphate synthase [Steroidobacteraceae bacterium]